MFDLQFLEELISYLDHWKDTVTKRDGCDDEEKKQMVLSNITDRGIRITGTYPAIIVCLLTIISILVSSFLELIPYLFKIKGVSSFLSEKISQDPLEKFFGVQRQQG